MGDRGYMDLRLNIADDMWNSGIIMIHKYIITHKHWWRHQMETFSALLALCAGKSPVTGKFPSQRPVTRSFDVFFDLRLNKWFSKQSWGWWFETPLRLLWRHCKAGVRKTANTHPHPHPMIPVHMYISKSYEIWKYIYIYMIQFHFILLSVELCHASSFVKCMYVRTDESIKITWSW